MAGASSCYGGIVQCNLGGQFGTSIRYQMDIRLIRYILSIVIRCIYDIQEYYFNILNYIYTYAWLWVISNHQAAMAVMFTSHRRDPVIVGMMRGTWVTGSQSRKAWLPHQPLDCRWTSQQLDDSRHLLDVPNRLPAWIDPYPRGHWMIFMVPTQPPVASNNRDSEERLGDIGRYIHGIPWLKTLLKVSAVTPKTPIASWLVN